MRDSGGGGKSREKSRDKSIVSEEGKKKAKKKALSERIADPTAWDEKAPDESMSGTVDSARASDVAEILREVGLTEKQIKKFLENAESISDILDSGGESDMDVAEPVPMW